MPDNFERRSLPQSLEDTESPLHQKEAQLLDTFKDLIDTRKALDESKDSYKTVELAIALAEKDPASAKAAAQRLIDKQDFEKAGRIAVAVGDDEFTKKVLEASPKNNFPTALSDSVPLEDVEPIKSNLTRWAKRDYFPSIDSVGKMASQVADKDPAFLKELLEGSLLNKESGTYPEVEAAGKIASALAKQDPEYAKGMMNKDLSAKYGGRIAGEVALALGDVDSARKAAEKCLATSSPDKAGKIAIAIGDTELAKKVLKESERYGDSTAGLKGRISLYLGDIDAAKAAVEQCHKAVKKDDRMEVNDQNSALEIARVVATKEPTYAKELVNRYFQHIDGDRASTLAGGVSFNTAQHMTLILAEKDPAFARQVARKFTDIGWDSFSDTVKAELFKTNAAKLEISPDEAAKLLESGNDKTRLAVGWFLKPDDLQKTLESVSDENIRRNALLGGMFNKSPEMYQRELVDIAFSSPDDPKFGRTLARCLVYFDYEQVSNIMLQKVKDAPDEKMLTRYLKTLIEIENPKGRTIATDLFTNREVNSHLRGYLAKKLITEKHWDPALGPVLQKSVQEGKSEEVDNTLVAMIKELGLTPDKPGYEALEKPGLLQGATLPERVQELKTLRQEFAQLSLDQLKERLKDERIRQVFYLVKGGEYRYTLINNYSYEKFSLVVGKVLKQNIDEGKMGEFEKSLEAAGVSAEQRQFILQSFREGRFPLENPEQRSIPFETSVELGSEYEIAFQRLQEIWGRELKALAVTSEQSGELPIGMDAALTTLEGVEVGKPKVQKVIEFLKQGEKQDYQSVRKIAEACKKDLIASARQKAKQAPDKQGAKDRITELERLNTSGILHAFLSERLPQLKDSAILSEWESHVRETLSTLEAGPAKGGSKNKRLELTFLDKGRDFVRSVRFADGRQCCFNSTNYNPEGGGVGGADWVSRLNADPLSFIMDVKEQDSRIVSGFVFGRMGIDPETKRPVVMLNGIYSQDSGGAVANNILKSIEDNFARKIGASSIVIASKYGGTLSRNPAGYKEVNRTLQAIRALQNSDKVYDDIGTVPNGTFTFSGYERKLS